MIRRVIGIILMLVGVTGLAICYLGAGAGRALLDDVAESADGVLETANSTLTTVEGSLEQARKIVKSTTGTLDQVRTTTANLSLAVDDTQPTLSDLALLVGEDIPQTISDVQDTIPNIVQTAKVVDDTLRLLSRMRVEETVPIINYEFSFGLGVEYDPEIPFDQAVEEVGRGLDPIVRTSGSLERDLQTAGTNMEVLSQDLNGLTADLDSLNEEVGAIRPLLDEYSALVNDMQTEIADGRTRLNEQLAVGKRVVLVFAIWFSLFQLLPLYFGLELALGNRMVRAEEMRLPVSRETDESYNASQSPLAPEGTDIPEAEGDRDGQGEPES